MAARAAVNGAKVLPPSSPFGELLRRSHFASYDPKIRQTYSAPASYISRGNWGLKRPIANKKKYSDIVLRNFEEHAQFIEWDKASAQVNLVKRVEELNIQPSLVPGTPWALGLGPSSTLIDSEFAPEELLKEARQQKIKKLEDQEQAILDAVAGIASASKKNPSFPQTNYSNAALDHISGRGQGAYGTKGKESATSADDSESFIQPNIAAMTPKRFDRYLEELRHLRPQFLQYIREELTKSRGVEGHGVDVAALSDNELVTIVGKEATMKSLHRFFLGQYTKSKLEGETTEATDATANTPQPIQGRPHKQAGLMYAAPTNIETFYSTRLEPGYILQEGMVGGNRHYHAGKKDEFVAAFAGVSSVLKKSEAGPGAVPLIEPFTAEGISAEYIPDESGGETISTSLSERLMRMVELKVERPPVVVGNLASNKPLHSVELRSTVIVDGGVDQNWRDNPYVPGSVDYSGDLPVTARLRVKGTKGGYFQPPHSKIMPNASVKNPLTSFAARRPFGPASGQPEKKEQSGATLDILKKMTVKPKREKK